MRIGVIGYSAQKFDKKKATDLLKKSFDLVVSENKSDNYEVVSGLTNLGIPALAYKEAKERNWKTVGIAPKVSEEFEYFPCDDVRIVGEGWGEESETFLNSIDILVKIGGGKQSKTELSKAKDMGLKVYEYDLEVEP